MHFRTPAWTTIYQSIQLSKTCFVAFIHTFVLVKYVATSDSQANHHGVCSDFDGMTSILSLGTRRQSGLKRKLYKIYCSRRHLFFV